ncbi:MAG: P-loop NTPase fold protein [Microcoleaceae cyanobacterium]
MELDTRRFFRAANPAKTLNISEQEDYSYYVDFSDVRGGKLIEQIARTITRLSPDSPTCQLFTGHIGSGKSTELLRLKSLLEAEDFHVIYFESSQDLDMADVEITDILLAISRQVSDNIEQLKITLETTRFKDLLQGIIDIFKPQIQLSDASNGLSQAIAQITVKTKDSRELRSLMRQYLGPRTNNILEAINGELLEPTVEQLKQRGKAGLVIIIDNLDRIMNSRTATGRPQPEYLFVDQGDQLNQLRCHVVYTIPLGLIFSSDLGRLVARFGSDPKSLPMVPVKLLNGQPCEPGLGRLRELVIARAFPKADKADALQFVPQVFDQLSTLDRLCLASGGHVRSLLVLLYSCLQREDPPLSRDNLEQVILQRRHQLLLAIESEEWGKLRQVHQTKRLSGLSEYQPLLRSLWVFEYHFQKDFWFDVNPILAEAPEFTQ